MIQAQALLAQATRTEAKQQSQHRVNPAWFLLPFLGAGLAVGELAYMMGTDAVADWRKAPAVSDVDVD